MENFKKYLFDIADMIIFYLPKITLAIVILIVGFWIIKILVKIFNRALKKRELEHSLQSFLSSLVSTALKILLIIMIAGMLGIQTTSFVAIIGALGLAIGLALQGSLANFAGGVLILLFKPFRVGDLIEVQGQFGEVKGIQVFNTILLTPENKTVILPNGMVSNGVIINVSKHGNLRVDITISVAPDSDVEKVRQVIKRAIESNPNVLKDPAPTINVLKLDNGMITLAIRPYSTPENYWKVYFEVQESIKTAFRNNGISEPVPHRIIVNKV